MRLYVFRPVLTPRTVIPRLTRNLINYKPEGTVKSNASYGLKALRKQLGVEVKRNKTCNKGALGMKECIDMYGVLFEYAKGYLTKKEREEVEGHIADCNNCAGIVGALTVLWPYLQAEFDQTGHDNYFNVSFDINGDSLIYTGFTNEFERKQVDEFNEMLTKNDGRIPKGYTLVGCGHDADLKHLSEYTNEGGRIEFELQEGTPGHVRVVYTAISKVYEAFWIYSVFMRENGSPKKQSKDAPGLYESYCANNLGKASKCGIFVFVEEGATNIRIKKGSGVLDLDGRKFAYSMRFTVADEKMDLSFTYNKQV